MASVKKIVLEKGSGKPGSTVAEAKNGENPVTDLADVLALKKPLTKGQRLQRKKMRDLQYFLKPFSAVLKVGFKNQAAGVSPKTKALSVNIPKIFVGSDKKSMIDMADVQLSEGYAAQLSNLKVVKKDGRLMGLTWDQCDHILGKYNVLSLVLYDEDQRKVFYIPNLGPVSRQEAEFLFEDFVGLCLHMFVFTVGMLKGVKNSNSNTQYLGMACVS
ncbi:DUF6266 family protein [Pedobacter gandavensis]|uniref:Uncharacterized protein n=1 Tax=Pedobacter gandavensis TaxID=2679963 RepID=A0ABR6EXA2_9SPHI|nr:DUF6266 family protein [Pedobacter gandavensis]MBB2149913.1 hypothetical protein [Pedobacter gandavensis]